MGKIADAFVEIGADDKPFKEKIKDLVYQVRRMSFNAKESIKDAFSANNVERLVERITGSGDAATVAGFLIRAGFGKALLAVTAVTAAVAATAAALDAVFSRDDDQKFADSVAGLTTGFRGLAEEIKNTDKKIAEIMSRDATGGNGGWFSLSSWKALGERVIGLETMTSQIARNMNNAATASKLFADNLVRGAIAGEDQARLRRGAEAAAGLRRTAGQQEEMRINAAAFKAVLDEQGGVRAFETVLRELQQNRGLVPAGMAPKEEAMRVIGALEAGDLAVTKIFGGLFDVADQRTKILADEFEKATGAGEELARMEASRIAKEKEFADARLRNQQRETDQAAKDLVKLEDQQASMAERLAQFQQDRADRLRQSFQFAGLREARDRLFMAAQDSRKDDLTASKMQNEIDRVVKALDALKLKWNMV